MLARAANGGWLVLEPYPDPAGSVRVDVMPGALIVLAGATRSSDRTKRYERHVCVPKVKPRPPEQLSLEV